MGSVWPRRPISQLCIEIIDCVNKTAPTTRRRTPFRMIRTTNVKGGFVDLSEVKHVEEDTYRQWTRRQVPRRGDVILTREAPLGEVGLVRDDEGIFLGQRLMSYRVNPKLLDHRFLLYSLLGPDLQGQIQALGSGSTVAHMRVPDAQRLVIPTPPLPLQHRIGSILGAYDELIDINRRRIALLEEMARRLFEEWFIHFRFPGAEGVPLTQVGDTQMPKGWLMAKLAEVATINGDTLKAAHTPMRIGYIDISSVAVGNIEKVEWMASASAPGRARRRVKDGSIIWSTVRPNRRSYALVLDPAPDTIVSTGFAVLDARTLPFAYLFHVVTTDEFVGYLTGNATGAAYPAVTGATFERASIVVPTSDLTSRFALSAEPMMRLAVKLKESNVRLAASRDLLLPRLISGDLSVATAERELVAAA